MHCTVLFCHMNYPSKVRGLALSLPKSEHWCCAQQVVSQDPQCLKSKSNSENPIISQDVGPLDKISKLLKPDNYAFYLSQIASFDS